MAGTLIIIVLLERAPERIPCHGRPTAAAKAPRGLQMCRPAIRSITPTQGIEPLMGTQNKPLEGGAYVGMGIYGHKTHSSLPDSQSSSSSSRKTEMTEVSD